MGTMVGDPYYAPISTLRSLAGALNSQLKTEIFTILNIFKYPDEGLNFSPFSGMFLWTHSLIFMLEGGKREGGHG